MGSDVTLLLARTFLLPGLLAALLVVGLTAGLAAQTPPPPGAKAEPPAAKESKQDKKHLNHLAKETSPYLLSHRHNPVNWYPWGPEALAKAKKENKPIFLSIGYSACHWCHVMERESFESEEIAKVMNEHFVCIKVDREERPDLDEIYMAAVTRISGSGGWPMSVWLTPERKPFWGGTYFPPTDKFGRPGFKRVCETLGKAWKDKRSSVLKDADNMATYLSQTLSPAAVTGKLSREFLTIAAADSVTRFDAQYGGFGRAPTYAPKFPHASELSTLLRNSMRQGDTKSLAMAEQTLQGMARGGIYDQLAGGFHRYSTDRTWLVPHFEKMLYDNALLAQSYVDAFLLTGKPFYKRIATETLDYLIREMQDPKGGFYSTTDADSEGVEGKYFVWTQAEVNQLLGEDAAAFATVYGVTESGNWHEIKGATVLSKVMTDEAAAKQLKTSVDKLRARLDRARATLLAARLKRVPPLKDDKVLAAWNGMAIAAMARGYQAFGDERYLAAGQRAAKFVLETMRDEKGRLRRTWRGGEVKLAGYLADYGFVADGLVELFQCDFEPQWLFGARELLDVAQKHFLDSRDGNFYFTADDHEELVARSKSVQESSTPSGTALIIRAFVKVGLLYADPKLVEVGRRALESNHRYLQSYPNYVVTMLSTVDLLLHDPKEVVIVGDPVAKDTQAFVAALRKKWPRDFVLTVLHPGNVKELTKRIPALDGKVAKDGVATAYVCTLGVCQAPVTDPSLLKLR